MAIFNNLGKDVLPHNDRERSSLVFVYNDRKLNVSSNDAIYRRQSSCSTQIRLFLNLKPILLLCVLTKTRLCR